jgi:hypothetical protein
MGGSFNLRHLGMIATSNSWWRCWLEWRWRAGLWHSAVEFADAGNPDQGKDREILEAP